MTTKKIYFKRPRDFGQVFSAAFGYMKQNFKSFYGSIILFTVPFVMLIVTLVAYLLNNAISSGENLARGGFAGEFLFFLMIIFIALLVVQTVFVTVMNQHLVLNEQLPENEFVRTEQIGKSFFSAYWRVLGNAILLGIIAVVFFVIYALVQGLVTAAFSALGVGGALLGAFLQLCITLIISPMLAYIFSSSMFIVQRDEDNIITALGKVFRYLRGNFWSTWAISLLGYLIMYVSSIVALLPMIIFVVVSVVSRIDYNSTAGPNVSGSTIVIGAIIFTVSISLVFCINSIYFLLCNFQYASLEEKAEGTNIEDKINQIQ
jgi:hypothetical protein